MGNTTLEIAACQDHTKSKKDVTFPTEPCCVVPCQPHDNDQKKLQEQEQILCITTSSEHDTCPVKNDDTSGPSLSVQYPQPLTGWQRRCRPLIGSHESYDLAVKIILLGDYSVGKTSFLRTVSRLIDEDGGKCCKEFRDGEMANVVFRSCGKRTLAKIIDTGGQEKYRSITSSYYKGAHGCLLVFDVTREETFNNIMTWFDDLSRYCTDQLAGAILVGITTPLRNRTVSHERGCKLADSLGVAYMECSPDSDDMAAAVVQRLTDRIIQMGIRRKSFAIEIRPRTKGKNKSNKTLQMNQMCLCA